MGRRNFFTKLEMVAALAFKSGNTFKGIPTIPSNSGQRLVFLDTETTGLMPEDGHRIVEIAAIEYIDNQPSGIYFHSYLNPEREIDSGAQEAHGLSLEFLQDKPSFADVTDDLQKILTGATVVIHNAPFDVGFLDHEFSRLGKTGIAEMCLEIVDSLKMARKIRPGHRNSLDALCHHYGIDTSMRTFHGALLDTSLLAQVYAAMTSQKT